MSGWSRHPMRGFALHDRRVSLDNLAANTAAATTSDYSQQGAKPGRVSGGDTLGSYLPLAHGGQGDDIDLLTVRPGLPRIEGGAGLAYRVDGDDDDLYRSWNEPVIVTGYRPVEFTTTRIWANCQACVIPDTQRVIVLAADANALDPISYWIWSPATRTWGSRAEIDANSAADLPAICALRSGRILAFFGLSGNGSAAIWKSDDNGDTWQEHAPFAMLPGVIDSTVTQVRMMEDAHGNLVLFAVAQSDGDIWQFASDDEGATWTEVDTIVTLVGGPISLARNLNDQLLLCYSNLADTDATRRIIADAYDPISDATSADIDGNNDATYVELCVDADNIAYAILSASASDVVKICRSVDGGSTWETYTDGIIQVGASVGTATNHQHRIRSAVACGGEILAFFTCAHNPSVSSAGSLVSLWLGGWSNLEHTGSAGTRKGRRGWADPSDADRNGIFLPTSTLEDYGWTHTGTTATLSAGYHRYSPTAATAYDTATAASHTSGNMNLRFTMFVDSGGSVTDNSCAMRHRRQNGTTETILVIRCSTTQFRILDGTGGGSVIDTIDVDLTSPIEFWIHYVDDSDVVVFYKRPQATRWITAASATLGTDATAGTTDIYQVGCIDSTTSTMRLGIFAFNNKDLRMGVDSTTLGARAIWGKVLTQRPYPIRELADAANRITHISAQGGAARFQESWDLSPDYDYGVRAAHPIETPNPSRLWRSADTTEQILLWDLGSNTRLSGSWAEALGLIRANFRSAVLEYSTAAASSTFVELGTYDATVVDGGSFALSGNLVTPAAGTVSGLHYHGAGDLRGGTIIFDPDGTPVIRRILDNTSGGWSSSGMPVAIEIDGVDGTEPTSGTLDILAPDGVLVCHRAAPVAYRRIRLRIPAQDTAEGHFELGNLLLGAVWVAGKQWSRGWSWRYQPMIRVEEDEQGIIYAEPRSSDEQRCYRRELTVAWQDGHHDGAMLAHRSRVLSASEQGPGLAAERDVWRQMVGYLAASRGGAIPSIAMMDVPRFTTTITDHALFSFGRLGVGQAAQRNNVQGSEGRGELERFESLTHVELIG